MKRRWFLVLSAGCMMGLLSACGLPMSENVQVEEFIANVLQPIFDANPDAVEQHASLSV